MQKVDHAIKIFPNDDTFRKICVVSKVIAKNSDRKPVNHAFAGFLVLLSVIRYERITSICNLFRIWLTAFRRTLAGGYLAVQ